MKQKYKIDMKQIRKENREDSKPTLWVNDKNGLIEIHYNSKTIIASVQTIDKETSRDASDDMALGSGFRVLETRGVRK